MILILSQLNGTCHPTLYPDLGSGIPLEIIARRNGSYLYLMDSPDGKYLTDNTNGRDYQVHLFKVGPNEYQLVIPVKFIPYILTLVPMTTQFSEKYMLKTSSGVSTGTRITIPLRTPVLSKRDYKPSNNWDLAWRKLKSMTQSCPKP